MKLISENNKFSLSLSFFRSFFCFNCSICSCWCVWFDNHVPYTEVKKLFGVVHATNIRNAFRINPFPFHLIGYECECMCVHTLHRTIIFIHTLCMLFIHNISTISSIPQKSGKIAHNEKSYFPPFLLNLWIFWWSFFSRSRVLCVIQ